MFHYKGINITHIQQRSMVWLAPDQKWAKPLNLDPNQAPREWKSPELSSREKSKGRKGIGIMNFLTRRLPIHPVLLRWRDKDEALNL
jgi:hypothetical protein